MKKWWLLLLVVSSFPASANFCKKDTTNRALQEARLLEKDSSFAVPGVSYIGQRYYNAMIITCNRKRDNHGGKIERTIRANKQFAKNLPAVFIKGKYAYYSTALLKYAYQLRREKGVWIVTVPMRFFWPSRKKDRIDIPAQLITDLGDPRLSSLCSKGGTQYDPNGKDVFLGMLPEDTTTKKGVDRVRYGEGACRVYRSMNVRGVNILVHLRKFFANAMKRVWDRPGFVIEPVLLDLGEATEAQRNAWEKGGLVWNIRMNLRPWHRTSYKRSIFKWQPIYSGIPVHVIGHEFGHWLGLDDEYGWGPDKTRTMRDCGKHGSAPREYIMCSQWASQGTNSAGWKRGAKAVYPWIVTRRYAVGKPPTCKKDSDCGSNQYCDKGMLTIGRNQCKAKKAVFAACMRSKQCQSGRCVLGSCKEAHECKEDSDCGAGKYCSKGAGSLSRNRCLARKPDWQSCIRDDQCASGKCSKWRPQDGQTSGICYTPSSKSAGSSCKIDLECKTGKCNSNKRCVCKRDSDCGRNQWCDKGLDLKENSCRDKLPKGARCGYGIGIGHRCLSGKCKLGRCK